MKEGIRFIRQKEGLPPLIVLAFFMTFLGVPLLVFLPVVVRDVFHRRRRRERRSTRFFCAFRGPAQWLAHFRWRRLGISRTKAK